MTYMLANLVSTIPATTTYMLANLVSTIPATTTSVERNFSSLQRIKFRKDWVMSLCIRRGTEFKLKLSINILWTCIFQWLTIDILLQCLHLLKEFVRISASPDFYTRIHRCNLCAYTQAWQIDVEKYCNWNVLSFTDGEVLYLFRGAIWCTIPTWLLLLVLSISLYSLLHKLEAHRLELCLNMPFLLSSKNCSIRENVCLWKFLQRWRMKKRQINWICLFCDRLYHRSDILQSPDTGIWRNNKNTGILKKKYALSKVYFSSSIEHMATCYI
jgi:hypothetical protein